MANLTPGFEANANVGNYYDRFVKMENAVKFSNYILRNRMVLYIFVTEMLHNMRRDVFQAIADPTRRDIINLLANESLTLNGVAENFNISRPAISKHIKILEECGLIIIKQEGRERYCEIQPEPLQEVNLWAEQYKHFWNVKLNSLQKFLEKKKARSKINKLKK